MGNISYCELLCLKDIQYSDIICDSRFDQWIKLNLFTDNQDVIRSHSRLPDTEKFYFNQVCTEFTFQFTGFDFAGPFLLKTCILKVLVLINVLLTGQITYLEVSLDMTFVSFINCFKRFISRCGAPTKVVSDYFKSFKLNETEAYFKKINVTWEPILENSTWWGGFHERLIAILKSVLRKNVGSAKLNFEELHTVLVQIENMINTRPLTYLSDKTCDEYITPSHLMYGRNINRRNVVDDNDNIITLDKTLIKTCIKHVTAVTYYFWNRFYKEYFLKNIAIIKTIQTKKKK